MEERFMVFSKLWTVTIDNNLSFRERVALGQFSYVDPDITEDHFPIGSGGKIDMQVKFFQPRRLVFFSQVIVKMKKKEKSLIGIEELFAIAARYPEVSMIVALGAVWRFKLNERRCCAVPCVYQVDGHRELGLQRFHCPPKNRRWDPDWRFPFIHRIVKVTKVIIKPKVESIEPPQGAQADEISL